MSRKRFSEREVIETLAWQGVFVCCHRCGKPFFQPLNPGPQNIGMAHLLKPEREHLHEYNLGGADKPYNCRYSCSECHSKITNGTKATSAGSSKQRIAKVKRLRGETKGRPKRKWPKGQKIKSRGFQKRVKS